MNRVANLHRLLAVRGRGLCDTGDGGGLRARVRGGGRRREFAKRGFDLVDAAAQAAEVRPAPGMMIGRIHATSPRDFRAHGGLVHAGQRPHDLRGRERPVVPAVAETLRRGEHPLPDRLVLRHGFFAPPSTMVFSRGKYNCQVRIRRSLPIPSGPRWHARMSSDASRRSGRRGWMARRRRRIAPRGGRLGSVLALQPRREADCVGPERARQAAG